MNRSIQNSFLMLLKSLLTAHADVGAWHKTLLVILLTNSTYLLQAQTVPARIEKLDLGTTIFFPQLLSGLFYCWLLSAYIKKKRAGLLAVNEDGSVAAAKPP